MSRKRLDCVPLSDRRGVSNCRCACLTRTIASRPGHPQQRERESGAGCSTTTQPHRDPPSSAKLRAALASNGMPAGWASLEGCVTVCLQRWNAGGRVAISTSDRNDSGDGFSSWTEGCRVPPPSISPVQHTTIGRLQLPRRGGEMGLEGRGFIAWLP